MHDVQKVLQINPKFQPLFLLCTAKRIADTYRFKIKMANKPIACWQNNVTKFVNAFAENHLHDFTMKDADDFGRFRTVSTRAREGECELGTLAIGKRCQERISATRWAGWVADSSRNPLSTRSMWRATGADGVGFARPLLVIAQLGKRVASSRGATPAEQNAPATFGVCRPPEVAPGCPPLSPCQ
jgi:hypothetical protein